MLNSGNFQIKQPPLSDGVYSSKNKINSQHIEMLRKDKKFFLETPQPSSMVLSTTLSFAKSSLTARG